MNADLNSFPASILDIPLTITLQPQIGNLLIRSSLMIQHMSFPFLDFCRNTTLHCPPILVLLACFGNNSSTSPDKPKTPTPSDLVQVEIISLTFEMTREP